MGGEPTFVSIDDLESPEWNIAAIGPTKQALADELIRKLHARFAPGGLLHYGQGKWYPGESLPRWAFGLYWRKDGVPIWKNAELIAKIDSPRKAIIEDAQKLMEGVARRLGLDQAYVMPAYEDSQHWLQKEAALPVNVDPGDSKLSDPEERSRMARVFDEGLNKPKGFVLPTQHAGADARIDEGLDQRALAVAARPLFLIPGDSPLGLRLPMASLLHVPPEEYPYIVEQDPMEPRPELAAEDEGDAAEGVPAKRAQKPRSKPKPVRTATSVEVRDGVLCAFMPPVEKVEDYFELIAAVEATAEEMQIPVHVEGYGPPYDPRVEMIKVTPDPGVIEINVQPAQSWRDAVDITFGLYEDAAKVGSAPSAAAGRVGNHPVSGTDGRGEAASVRAHPGLRRRRPRAGSAAQNLWVCSSPDRIPAPCAHALPRRRAWSIGGVHIDRKCSFLLPAHVRNLHRPP